MSLCHRLAAFLVDRSELVRTIADERDAHTVTAQRLARAETALATVDACHERTVTDLLVRNRVLDAENARLRGRLCAATEGKQG